MVTFTYDETVEILDEICGEIPREFYKHLNGGIILSEERKRHTKDVDNTLYIMGEYQNINIGRTIVIYYGSFRTVYAGASPEEYRKQLRLTLLHEFTHHLESLAGVKDLEIKDAVDILKYLKNKE